MLLAATDQLATGRTDMSATFLSLQSGNAPISSTTLAFPPDLMLDDSFGGYEVRVAASAAAEMHAWVSRSERLAPGAETGGILFGERDDALRVLWVSDVLGPPPDSEASTHGFICGTEGVDAATTVIRKRSRGASKPVGMWHTHPGSIPIPSETDFEGMTQIISGTQRSLPKQLLMIVGGSGPRRVVGAFLHDRYRPIPAVAFVHPVPLLAPRKPDHRIGIALSGGGFRAVAFHLGVLRALHDRGVLDHVEVLSTVSGGSLIGGIWAYSDDDFATFDRKVTDLLRSRLNWRIARRLFATKRTPQVLASAVASAAGSGFAMAWATAKRTGRLFSGRSASHNVEPLPRQWINRTTAVQDVFEGILGDKPIGKPKRDLHVIVNACDLRSGSAFRFGSVESGCSRYGRLSDNTLPVSLAVAASAAYPCGTAGARRSVGLSVGREGRITKERLLLTDGGVFDNLGTSCLEPGRNPSYSTNVHPVDYIISADAGRGVLDHNRYPLWWPHSNEAVLGIDLPQGPRHREGAHLSPWRSPESKGLCSSIPGPERQATLYDRPADLIRREDVIDYPTNFSQMPNEGHRENLTTR